MIRTTRRQITHWANSDCTTLIKKCPAPTISNGAFNWNGIDPRQSNSLIAQFNIYIRYSDFRIVS